MYEYESDSREGCLVVVLTCRKNRTLSLTVLKSFVVATRSKSVWKVSSVICIMKTSQTGEINVRHTHSTVNMIDNLKYYCTVLYSTYVRIELIDIVCFTIRDK